jgi:hypothetical protein
VRRVLPVVIVVLVFLVVAVPVTVNVAPGSSDVFCWLGQSLEEPGGCGFTKNWDQAAMVGATAGALAALVVLGLTALIRWSRRDRV